MEDKKKPREAWVVQVAKSYGTHIVTHIIAAPIISIIFFALRGVRGFSKVVDLLEERPVYALAVITSALACSYLLFRVVDYVQPKIGRYFAFRRLVRESGLEDFYPRTQGNRAAEWAKFLDLSEEQDSDSIRILGVTGAETFAKKTAPLHELLNNHQGDLQILLIADGSDAFNERVHELAGGATENPVPHGERLDGFRRELAESLKFCETLASKPTSALRSIEVRVYRIPALWKLVFIGDYVWMQHYEPKYDVDHSHAYILGRGHDCSLYKMMARVFLRRWQMAEDSIALKRDADGRKWVRGVLVTHNNRTPGVPTDPSPRI